jgi:acetyl esterase/lipase
MMIDAYRALESLALHPRIDPSRVAVMGFSKGAAAAVYSSNERFRKLYGPPNVEFAAHIGFYTPCYMYHDDDKVTGKPIRLFHGIDDDLNSIEPCCCTNRITRYLPRIRLCLEEKPFDSNDPCIEKGRPSATTMKKRRWPRPKR